MAVNPQIKFQTLLIELFQLSQSDLDFGIYRIINERHADVEKFINEVLPKTLKNVKAKLSAKNIAQIEEELETAQKELEEKYEVDFTKPGDLEEKAKSQIGQLKLFKEPYERYLRAREKLVSAQVPEDVERDIYNELYRFFSRYYDSGDFVTRPRSGDNAYMIPYNGEEVKLYCANHDQYYIKATENFRSYTFKSDDMTVEFRLKDVETTANNNQNQKGRVFIPAEDWFEWKDSEKILTLWFYYKVPSEEEKLKWGEKQSVKSENRGINERLIFRELGPKIQALNSEPLNNLWKKEHKQIGKDTVKDIHYHLHRFTSINSSDYFIHKNLKK
ncbi:MAG: hypothetical protein Q7J65_00735, partial [Candidatus Marinimicrobia bacterium]|nr:hypothetical protein [Candidatus Neomarinimicrobiota bacterium]